MNVAYSNKPVQTQQTDICGSSRCEKVKWIPTPFSMFEG